MAFLLQFFTILLGSLMVGFILFAVFYVVRVELKKQRSPLIKQLNFSIIQNTERHEKNIHNDRIRGKDLTLFDIALSEEADFTKHPNGNKIIESIRCV